jgi:hypothetical protein
MQLWMSGIPTASAFAEGQYRRPAPFTMQITAIEISFLEQCKVEYDDCPNNARFSPSASSV